MSADPPSQGPKHQVDLGGGRDPCVVDTEPLAEIVRTFASNWRRSRPSISGRYDGQGLRVAVEPIGPYEALAAQTGLPESRITSLLNPARKPTTELRVAEAIVAAIGEPGMFYDGTLTVRPNPRARRERQAEADSWSAASLGFSPSAVTGSTSSSYPDSATGSGSSG
jgi:hypothetical protein